MDPGTRINFLGGSGLLITLGGDIQLDVLCTPNARGICVVE